MSQLKINPAVNDGGFTAAGIKKSELQNASISSWTQFYHQPYQCDMAEARQKAIERKYKDA